MDDAVLIIIRITMMNVVTTINITASSAVSALVSVSEQNANAILGYERLQDCV